MKRLLDGCLQENGITPKLKLKEVLCLGVGSIPVRHGLSVSMPNYLVEHRPSDRMTSRRHSGSTFSRKRLASSCPEGDRVNW